MEFVGGHGFGISFEIKWKTVEKAAPAKTPGAASWRIRTQNADAPRHRVLLLAYLAALAAASPAMRPKTMMSV